MEGRKKYNELFLAVKAKVERNMPRPSIRNGCYSIKHVGVANNKQRLAQQLTKKGPVQSRESTIGWMNWQRTLMTTLKDGTDEFDEGDNDEDNVAHSLETV